MLRSPGTLSENRTSGPFIEALFSSSSTGVHPEIPAGGATGVGTR